VRPRQALAEGGSGIGALAGGRAHDGPAQSAKRSREDSRDLFCKLHAARSRYCTHNMRALRRKNYRNIRQLLLRAIACGLARKARTRFM
jgi:hypothetical protein